MADIFTDVGEALQTDFIDGTAAVPGTWFVGWGTGAGTAAKGDTTLFTEASESRVAGAASQPSADINRFVATITADGAKTITNAGLLSASSGGTLFIHGDFTGIVLALGDKIEFTIDIEWT